MRVLVIGGAGFLGRRLCRRLSDAGLEIFGADTSEGDTPAVGQAFHRLDVSNRDAVDNLVAVTRPNVIVNLAYVTGDLVDTDLAWATNVNLLGQVHCFDAAARHGVQRFVYASSIAAYGADQAIYGDREVVEADGCPLDRHSLTYGAMKAYNEFIAERYRLENDLEVCGVRLSVVYGPGRTHGYTAWTSEMITHPPRGLKVIFPHSRDQEISLVSIDDAARLLSMVARSNRLRYSIVNSGGHTLTPGNIAEKVKAVYPQSRFEFEPHPSPSHFVTRVSGQRARKEFGFELSPFADDLCGGC